MGAVLIRLIPFPTWCLVHLRLSVPPAHTLGETSQMIGTVSAAGKSGKVCSTLYNFTNLFIRWIYVQFIAVDANFKLKLKNRQIRDPELGSGWAYFVENEAYTRHVADNPHQKDICMFKLFEIYVLMLFLGYELWE